MKKKEEVAFLISMYVRHVHERNRLTDWLTDCLSISLQASKEFELSGDDDEPSFDLQQARGHLPNFQFSSICVYVAVD